MINISVYIHRENQAEHTTQKWKKEHWKTKKETFNYNLQLPCVFIKKKEQKIEFLLILKHRKLHYMEKTSSLHPL